MKSLSPRQNFVAAICRTNPNWFEFVRRIAATKISASSLVEPYIRICDNLVRQNLDQLMRKHQLVSRHVKFELVYISSLQKSITCTEQVSYRGELSQDQCGRGDLSPRCVAAICRILCLGLKSYVIKMLLLWLVGFFLCFLQTSQRIRDAETAS